MLLAKHTLTNLQHTAEKRFSAPVVALAIEQHCQVVHAFQGAGIFFTKHTLFPLQSAAV